MGEGGEQAGLSWAEPELEIDDELGIDESQLTEADRQMYIRAKANHIGLFCRAAARHSGPADGADVIDFTVRCVADAHPECRFRWVRVLLDLGTAAQVLDLSPQDEAAELPVTIATSYQGGLSFDRVTRPAGPAQDGDPEVYYPAIAGSGVGLGQATWDFTAIGDDPLHAGPALRLLASVPAGAAEVPVALTLRASVSARGFLGRIPLVGRQAVAIPLNS
jgi:hypothetical protein